MLTVENWSEHRNTFRNRGFSDPGRTSKLTKRARTCAHVLFFSVAASQISHFQRAKAGSSSRNSTENRRASVNRPSAGSLSTSDGHFGGVVSSTTWPACSPRSKPQRGPLGWTTAVPVSEEGVRTPHVFLEKKKMRKEEMR